MGPWPVQGFSCSPWARANQPHSHSHPGWAAGLLPTAWESLRAGTGPDSPGRTRQRKPLIWKPAAGHRGIVSLRPAAPLWSPPSTSWEGRTPSECLLGPLLSRAFFRHYLILSNGQFPVR